MDPVNKSNKICMFLSVLNRDIHIATNGLICVMFKFLKPVNWVNGKGSSNLLSSMFIFCRSLSSSRGLTITLVNKNSKQIIYI